MIVTRRTYNERHSLREVHHVYNKPMLELDQCQAAVQAMIAEFNTDPNRRPVDVAIVDDLGNLLAYARMDRCRRPTFAIDKAYTAATRSMDTAVFAETLKKTGKTVAFFNDSRLTTIPGGVVVTNPGDGSILGGIGVGGLPTGEEDEVISRAGLKALNL